MPKTNLLKQVEKKIQACEIYLTKLKKKSPAGRTQKKAK